jgi:tetratricopeptide (TPR) repeat protein
MVDPFFPLGKIPVLEETLLPFRHRVATLSVIANVRRDEGESGSREVAFFVFRVRYDSGQVQMMESAPPLRTQLARSGRHCLSRPEAGIRVATVLLVLFAVVSVVPYGVAAESHQDPLDEARALSDAGELELAAKKAAKVVAASPGRGAAHLVLGLIHYRAGGYQEALLEFAAARASAVPAQPGPTALDEGAVWFALGKYGKARALFEEAARIAPDLAFLATLDAAEAALAEGELGVARGHLIAVERLATSPERHGLVREFAQRLEGETHAARIRRRKALRERARTALADEQPAQAASIYRELLADGDEPLLSPAERNLFEHGLGLALLRQKRFDESIVHFARAAAIDRHDGDSLFMEGLAYYRKGADPRARALLWQALDRGVDKEAEASVHTYLDRLSFSARRGGSGFSAGLSAGLGYDSNVIQGLENRPGTITADQVGSPGAFLASMSANLGYDRLVRKTGFAAVD